jgi:N-acetylglutamate synthase-like GNAT family acetyltransferase
MFCQLEIFVSQLTNESVLHAMSPHSKPTKDTDDNEITEHIESVQRESVDDESSTIIVRAATSDDVEKLDQFIAPFVEDKRLLPRTLDELEELIRTGFIAELDGMFVGFAALEIYSRKLAEVRSLAVSPIYQGKGIGKSLVTACIELAREKEILEVMAITASEEFFRHCGFDETLPGQKKALFYQTREI